MRTTTTRMTALLLAAVLVAATLVTTTLLPASEPWQAAAYAAEMDGESDAAQQEAGDTSSEGSEETSGEDDDKQRGDVQPNDQEQGSDATEGQGAEQQDDTEGTKASNEKQSDSSDSQSADDTDSGNAQAASEPPVLRGPLRSPTPTWPDLEGEAYACYEPTYRYLTLFRSNDTVVDGEQQTVTDIYGRTYTGIIWGGIETTAYASAEDVPWYTSDGSVRPSRFEIGYRCTIRPISCAWWLGCVGRYVSYVGLDGLDTSHCTNMASMFRDCYNLWNINVSGFDTSNVTDMSGMFASCSYITSLDLSGFDTSSVTTMGGHSATGGMFCDCSRLRTLDITGWDTSNVTDMSGLFAGCGKLSPVPTGQLDTSACTDMRHMFASCSTATSLDLTGFDTSNVTNMASMFYRCNKLESIDLTSFDTSLVTDMSSMFQECKAVTSLDLSPLETPLVTNMKQIFWGCESLESLDMSSLDTHAVTDFTNSFYNDSKLERVVLGRDLTFSGAGITNTSKRMTLPPAPSDETHTGWWCREDDHELTYYHTTLRDTYDGTTMAGTYIWATFLSYPLTLDLAGGSVPEGEEYPTEYVATKVTKLPGIEGTGLSYPVREGYAFVGWLDEGGTIRYRIESDSTGPRTFTAKWRPTQMRMRVPVSATFVARQQPGGTMSLEAQEGDFELSVENLGNMEVNAFIVARPAEGFRLVGGSGSYDKAVVDVWFTPVTTGSDPTAEGYDPATDDGYQEYAQVKASECREGSFRSLGTPLEPEDQVWLNSLGGTLSGWTAGGAEEESLMSIEWSFEQVYG